MTKLSHDSFGVEESKSRRGRCGQALRAEGGISLPRFVRRVEALGSLNACVFWVSCGITPVPCLQLCHDRQTNKNEQPSESRSAHPIREPISSLTFRPQNSRLENPPLCSDPFDPVLQPSPKGQGEGTTRRENRIFIGGTQIGSVEEVPAE